MVLAIAVAACGGGGEEHARKGEFQRGENNLLTEEPCFELERRPGFSLVRGVSYGRQLIVGDDGVQEGFNEWVWEDSQGRAVDGFCDQLGDRVYFYQGFCRCMATCATCTPYPNPL